MSAATCEHHIEFKACAECRGVKAPTEDLSEFLTRIPTLARPARSGAMTLPADLDRQLEGARAVRAQLAQDRCPKPLGQKCQTLECGRCGRMQPFCCLDVDALYDVVCVGGCKR